MYYEKKCAYCGKIFNSKRFTAQFCSPSCYAKKKRENQNKEKVDNYQKDQSLPVPILHEGYLRYRHVCEYCGKSFLSPKENVKFCSKSCYRKQIRGLKKDEASTQKLKEKKEIAEYYAEHYKGKSMAYPKTCALCGQRFVAHKITTIFCSTSCARKFRRHQSNEEKKNRITHETSLQVIARQNRAVCYKDNLRPSEAAEYLGLERTTIYRYIKQGILVTAQLPGVTLIRRDSLENLLIEGCRFRPERISRERKVPEVSTSPVISDSSEYISIADAAKAYGLPLNVTQNYLRRSSLKFERFRNIRFYKRVEVDILMRKREKNRYPDISEWYTVEDIMERFGLTRKGVYDFVYKHDIPKRKDGLKASYSKQHVDEIFVGTDNLNIDYYTPEEIVQKYKFDKRRLYKLVQRLGLPKRNVSGKLWIEKAPFDEFMTLNSLPPV